MPEYPVPREFEVVDRAPFEAYWHPGEGVPYRWNTPREFVEANGLIPIRRKRLWEQWPDWMIAELQEVESA